MDGTWKLNVNVVISRLTGIEEVGKTNYIGEFTKNVGIYSMVNTELWTIKLRLREHESSNKYSN